MGLSPGARVGGYQILATLGAGGMGEVYRARDPKLDRDVALKVLPEAFVADADRVTRFEREAKTLAALNHPNIAHVYDAGREGSTAYLAMELVEGEDLSAIIQRHGHGIPLSDALPLARQIIDALEAAHELGIVHRDLKPANIKVRDDGTVKVLDFGLAKAIGPDGSSLSGDAANSPTLTARATQMGVVLGTAAYMAPEQARGRQVDRRADVWAFGVVLYEMLTGHRAFEGEDISVTLANVIKEDARWDALPGDVPAPVRRLLKRCLQKDPKRRLSAVGDARFELDPDASEIDQPASGARKESSSRSGALSKIWPALLGAAVVAVIGYVLWPQQSAQPVSPLITFEVPAPPTPMFKLSPDGRNLAIAAAPSTSGGLPVISIRPMDGVESRVLPGTEGAGFLFWSPTSDALGYLSGNALYRIGLSGGSPQKLCDVVDFSGATWTRGGDIITSSFDGRQGKLLRVAAQGGTPVELPRPKATGAAVGYNLPVIMSDDRHLMYYGWNVDASQRGIFVGTIDGAEPVRVMPSLEIAVLAPGYLLFAQGNSMMAQPFDEATLKLSGTPVRISDRMTDGLIPVSVSRNGLLAYRRSDTREQLSQLTWLDRAGKPVGIVGESGIYEQVRLSPDNRRIATEESDTSGSKHRVSILDLGNGVLSPFTDEALRATDPVWSPSGETVAFVAFGKSNEIMTQQIGTANAVTVVESNGRTQWLDDWAADGKTLLLHTSNTLYTAAIGDPKSVKAVLTTTGALDSAHFSPDGKWVSYQVEESGVPQVWIASYPAFDQRRQVSAKGGGAAAWRSDGSELFYLTPTGQLMTAHVGRSATSGALDLSASTALFQSPIPNPRLVVDQYWPSKDGQRFLFVGPVKTSTVKVEPITVIVNWMSQLAPAKPAR